ARVLATAIRGLPAASSILVTAFGPFAGVENNPTAAFVGERAWLERSVGLAFPGAQACGSETVAGAGSRHHFNVFQKNKDVSGRAFVVMTAVLALAATEADALAGRYFGPEVTAANFRRVLAAQ